MDRLGQINLKNTVSVKVDCQVNEEVILSNFQIIMNCLKQLKGQQDRLNKGFKDLDSKYHSLSTQQTSNNPEGEKREVKEAEKVDVREGQGKEKMEDLLKMIKEVQRKTDMHGQSIIGNVKDISTLQKEMQEVKEEIQKLKQKKQSQGNVAFNEGTEKKEEHQSFNNVHKEIQRNNSQINKLNNELQKIKEEMNKMQEELNKLKDRGSEFDRQKEDKGERKEEGGSNQSDLKNLRDMIRELRDDIRDLSLQNKKNKEETRQIRGNVNQLKNTSEQQQKQIQNILNTLKNIQISASVNSGDGKGLDQNLLSDILRQLSELNQLKNLPSQFKKLASELEKLKHRVQELERNQKINSKNSIEDGSSKLHDKASYTQTKFHNKDDDKLRQIIQRLEYLEKMMGNKHTTEGDGKSDKDKLPLIKKNRLAKEKDSSFYDRSSNKKDMLEIKNQLQNWLNNYLGNLKSKDNFEDLELRIQELKIMLNRKADQEGVKKGLAFLQNKINQLFLFLTQPDGEDAMIVRKGFNCLSCSKKVQKLRGKIGPHVNWANMTATNYSPPKVGYSKNMGEGTIDKDDDL